MGVKVSVQDIGHIPKPSPKIYVLFKSSSNVFVSKTLTAFMDVIFYHGSASNLMVLKEDFLSLFKVIQGHEFSVHYFVLNEFCLVLHLLKILSGGSSFLQFRSNDQLLFSITPALVVLKLGVFTNVEVNHTLD